MSYITLDSIRWGGVPQIGVSFGYESQRSGSSMQYRIWVTIDPLTGASYFGYPIYLSVYVDGSGVTSGYTMKAASPNRWSSAITYNSGWVTVTGYGSYVPLSIRLYSGSGSSRDDSYSYTLPVERMESIGDFTLTAGNATMGQTGTLTLTRPGYGYSCQFSYTFGGVTETLGSGTLQTVSSSEGRAVYQWTVPTSLMTRIPNATWGSGTMTAKIYGGGSYIGSVSDTFTLYVPDSVRPEAAVTTTVVNDNAVLQGWGLCVQGMSRVQYAVSVTLKGGASLADCQFRLAGEARSGTSGTVGPLGGSGVQASRVTVTDSRGRAETVYGSSIRVYEYRPPVITASAAVRCSASGTEQDDGAYLKVRCAATCSMLAGQNEVTTRVRYRAMGGQWSAYTALLNGAETIIGGGLEASRAYEVELRAEDTVGTVRTVRYTAATKQVTVHLRSGGKGLALGKYAEAEALECAWPAVFYGDVAVSGSLKVNGAAVEERLFPVGSAYLTATAAAPELPGTWQQVQAGLSGVYVWRRTT